MFNALLNSWTFLGGDKEKELFSTLQDTLEQEGVCLSKDPISSVQKVTHQDSTYYVKVYTRNGKGLRHYLGRGRLQGEWENLLFFSKLGIPTPRIIAYGQRRQKGLFKVGALITQEVPYSIDLLTLVKTTPQKLHNRSWLKAILRQTSDYTSRLHQHGFIHWDLKWRNILISTEDENNPQVFFFDCPLGRIRQGWLRNRGIVKDLACLDKVGKKALSRTQRLRFFKYYEKTDRLTSDHKRKILQIINFFADE